MPRRAQYVGGHTAKIYWMDTGLTISWCWNGTALSGWSWIWQFLTVPPCPFHSSDLSLCDSFFSYPLSLTSWYHVNLFIRIVFQKACHNCSLWKSPITLLFSSCAHRSSISIDGLKCSFGILVTFPPSLAPQISLLPVADHHLGRSCFSFLWHFSDIPQWMPSFVMTLISLKVPLHCCPLGQLWARTF